MPAQYDRSQWVEIEPGVRVRSHTVSEENGDSDATAAAIARAEELGVDLATVTGTGKNGRITVGDVEAAAP